MLPYTLCLIKYRNNILLLNRNKAPNMGLWNGVGGKIEQNESPFEGVIREAYEETGILLEKVIYSGNVIWQSNRGDSGMYVFMAELPSVPSMNTPCQVEEGILAWKDIDWILEPNNKGVVSNMKHYLPKILAGHHELEHRFIYENGEMVHYEAANLEVSIRESKMSSKL
ncbi:NUDIX hydrolase [Bacillus dakarensis]|uniref:NUDIX hydrolase n=1 Tax=Robertmurraya dakarensis TaxID=1926278 RepID=UPI00098198E5|nr:8-oxo-dGTP diphosphatase [Bacillus dakarensis]